MLDTPFNLSSHTWFQFVKLAGNIFQSDIEIGRYSGPHTDGFNRGEPLPGIINYWFTYELALLTITYDQILDNLLYHLPARDRAVDRNRVTAGDRA